MSEKSKIAWTDSTVNFWEGCTKVSAGCANCYAEARDKRFTGGKLWGLGAPRRKSKTAVKAALAMNAKPWICDFCGTATDDNEVCCNHRDDDGIMCNTMSYHRRRIFSLSLGDWLDNEVPIEWFVEMMQTVLACEDVTWILCSKRPENFQKRMAEAIQYLDSVK
jgi:protein gp37